MLTSPVTAQQRRYMIKGSILFLAVTFSFSIFATTSATKANVIVTIQKSTLLPEGEKIESICKFKGAINKYDGRTSFPRIAEADVKTFTCNYKGEGRNLSITFGVFASVIASKFIKGVVPHEIFGTLVLNAAFPLLLVKSEDDEEEYQPGISTVIGSADLKSTSLFGALTPEVSEICDINGENCATLRPFSIKASFLITEL
jgi:hypothetical protein